MAEFKFIDLFAGIGGFHLAMHKLGGTCVFASEIDKFARLTYEANFKKISPELFDQDLFNDDIRKITPDELPDFDILCAGFPCQPFSQAGLKRGFDDNHNSERGNLFFNIADIIRAKRPKAFFLENVRGLLSHDKGNTIKIIRDILEDELGYSFYVKIVRASDYGLPQLRPRAFMIGFRDDSFMKTFNFPEHIKLKYTMSDVWGGECSRDIGFTLRVGGRGSEISDRRNWDSYLVNGEIKRLSYIEAKKMQGFPDDFEFPVSPTQAIKQLGNSVAVDAVEAVAKQIVQHLSRQDLSHLKINYTEMVETKNKGEWTELLVFIKLMLEKQLNLSDELLNANSTIFKLSKLTILNSDKEYTLSDTTKIDITDKKTNIKTNIKTNLDIVNLITPEIINSLKDLIKNGSRTFSINEFSVIQQALGLTVIKGGNSDQKADIILDIENNDIKKVNEGFGIKSYLGSKPTLFNASGTTNFIYKIIGIDKSEIDNINNIDTKSKIRDRIGYIEQLGGQFNYIGAENSTLSNNLKMVDGDMPNIIGEMLLHYYKDRVSMVTKIVDMMSNGDINYKQLLEVKVKRLLVDVLLGFFPGSKWDGAYQSNGTIVMKNDGECVCFHIIELESLKTYLFDNIKFDTPSSTRHRFGNIYLEKDGNLYFKLNMQLRF